MMDEANTQAAPDSQEDPHDAATHAPSEAASGAAGNVQAPEYEDLSSSAATGAGGHPSLDIVLDVPVTVSLEVGKATMSVGELIKLGQGAVVELDRAVGEPLDVMVNGALVAHGEIVLVNEKFGIRLTSVVKPAGAQEKEAV
jgi:flagellar motor switch protein FliN/FliY